MPMVYFLSLATPGNLTTNATPNTETDAFFVKPGTRSVYLTKVQVGGKSNALSTITGLAFRLIKLATASTAGTTITPTPPDVGMQAAKATSASRPTIGTTRLNGPVFFCGATGPGGWDARDADYPLVAEGGAAGSIDMVDVSGGTSLPYEFHAAIQE